MAIRCGRTQLIVDDVEKDSHQIVAGLFGRDCKPRLLDDLTKGRRWQVLKRVGSSPSAITGKSSRGNVERLKRERPATTCIFPSAALSSTWLPSGSLRTMSKKVCAETVVGARTEKRWLGWFRRPGGQDPSPSASARHPRVLQARHSREWGSCCVAPRPTGRARGSSEGQPAQSSLSLFLMPHRRTRNGSFIASRSARGSGDATDISRKLTCRPLCPTAGELVDGVLVGIRTALT